jgi:hypothetical protein
MKNIITLLLILMGPTLTAESQTSPRPSQVDMIWEQYESYKEKSITNRFLKHKELVELIAKLTKDGKFNNAILGHSVEGRSIHHLTIGKGKTKILLWSQMHGDESTATMALLDIFNFFNSTDQYDSFRKQLVNNLELHFVPMLNPDGAEVWKRRNAFGIDINRDAVALVTPEAKILKKIADEIKPIFGFNLHDQSSLYSVGFYKEPATISFLAPAFDYAQTENKVRKNAMKLIVSMYSHLQKYIPAKVSRYNDTFEPRAFGDNFQSWGIATVLIESGGYKDDIEKQFIRKLNFYTILQAFESIATQSFPNEKLENYHAIPVNSHFNYDLVIRNIAFTQNGHTFLSNLGINQEQLVNPDLKSVRFKATIAEIGDMTNNFGYEEIDAKGLHYGVPKTKEMSSKEWDTLSFIDEIQLLQQGYLYVKLNDNTKTNSSKKLVQLTECESITRNIPEVNKDANFTILDQNKSAKYAVIQGFCIDLSQDPKKIAFDLKPLNQ